MPLELCSRALPGSSQMSPGVFNVTQEKCPLQTGCRSETSMAQGQDAPQNRLLPDEAVDATTVVAGRSKSSCGIFG